MQASDIDRALSRWPEIDDERDALWQELKEFLIVEGNDDEDDENDNDKKDV